MKTLRILLLEDSEDDALLLERAMRDAKFKIEMERVGSQKSFMNALERGGWDAIVADYNVPGFNALAALEIVHKKRVDLPFIVVSGEVGEEKAVEAMRAGAHDFVLKGNYSRLMPALERELHAAAERREREESERLAAQALRESEVRERARREELEALMQSIPAAVWIAEDARCERITGNKVAAELLRVEPQRNVSLSSPEGVRTHQVRIGGRPVAADDLPMQRAAASGKPVIGTEIEIVRADGTSCFLYGSAMPLFSEKGEVRGCVGTFIDITERKAAERALQEAHDLLEARVAERTAALTAANNQLALEMAERRRLEEKIGEVGEAERQALRHELHDGLCQELAGIGFMANVLARNLAKAQSPSVTEAETVAALVNDTLNHTRQLARGVSPVEPTEEGLMSALKELCSSTARAFDIRCEFRCPHPVPVRSNYVAGHLYRIAQEAAHNAIEHGKAKNVIIELIATRSGKRLSIIDDGSGFIQKDASHPGMGVRVMHHRAASIGGTLRIEPVEGGGTKVVCEWKTE